MKFFLHYISYKRYIKNRFSHFLFFSIILIFWLGAVVTYFFYQFLKLILWDKLFLKILTKDYNQSLWYYIIAFSKCQILKCIWLNLFLNFKWGAWKFRKWNCVSFVVRFEAKQPRGTFLEMSIDWIFNIQFWELWK